MYFDFESIKTIEVELTSYCNSHCGACHRNISGGKLASHMKLEHMSAGTWSSLITPTNLIHIDTFNFDGNVGDASMHPHFIDMLEDLYRIKPNLNINISTNGGARSPRFWGSLAETLLKFRSHRLTFSVDGLEDTNHLYRRGVQWDRLMQNIYSFNSAGGYSRWRCLVFDHNIHQLDEIEKKAKELGCGLFVSFRNRQSPINQVAYKSFPQSTLTSPSLETFESKYRRVAIFKEPSSQSTQTLSIEQEPFNCPFAAEGKIAMDQQGYVWPCCFTSVANENSFPVNLYMKNNNITKFPLSDILTFFQNDLFSAWKGDSYHTCKKCLHKTSPPTYSPRPTVS